MGPRLWNELPLHIMSAKSLSMFKKLLKAHFEVAAYVSLIVGYM